MDYAVVISAIVLGLSVLATIAKFLDWFVHSDPKTMVRTSRWMLLLLVLACIPLLIVMIANQQWPAAMLIGAGMLIVPTLLKWRAIFAPLRAAFGYFRPKPRPFDMEIWDDEAAGDPEMVRRAAAILEAYLGKSSLVALGDGRRGAPRRGRARPVAPGSPRGAGPGERTPTRRRSAPPTSACSRSSIPTAAARPISPGRSSRQGTRLWRRRASGCRPGRIPRPGTGQRSARCRAMAIRTTDHDRA